MTKAVNLVLIMLVFGLLLTPGTSAQTTEISYQGNLNDGSSPANANYDIEFRLFDAAAGGLMIGSPISYTQVAVTNGVFSVKLDFGQTAFPGFDRYLEIAVRRTGVGSLTTLGPRQKIASAPYAIQSLRAATATIAISANNAQSLGGQSAGQYVLTGDPRMTDARNPLAGSPNYIQNTIAPQAGSNFNIAGNGTANIFNATTSFNFGGSHLISSPGFDNIFAGNFSGPLNSGNKNAFFGARAGRENKAGSFNAFFGAHAGENNVTGNSNSFFGYFAGNGTTSGSENSFFGNRAGQVNTSGAFNSFFGTFSGLFNSTGSDNSFFGSETGFTNTNGNKNSFFGSKAGRENSTGADNSFLGSFAGRANTTGSRNAFVGSQAGQANATGNNNSFVGTGAGFSNTASFNSFFGTEAGYENTTGAHNTFVGRNAGRGNTAGELNIFIGVNAGTNNVLGSSNTVIGSEANVLGSNLSYATAIGAEAVVNSSNTVVLGRPSDTVRVPGNINVTGNLNLTGTLTAGTLTISANNISGVIGTANGGTGISSAGIAGRFLRSDGSTWQSLPLTVADILPGSTNYIQNSSIQQGSTNFNISGNGTLGGMLSANAVNTAAQYNIGGVRVLSAPGLQNTFTGISSGNGNTTGGSNSFFGHSAGIQNTSGSSNSFFGTNSGSASTTGGNNTFIGSSAGTGNGAGSNNSYFGVNAGQSNTTGSNNTVLGANANTGGSGLTYATAIGADAVVSTNNTVVLGRSIDTVRAPGNLQVDGTLTASNFSIPANNLTGVVPVLNGGTGVSASGAAGNYLRSNGSNWVSSAIAANDIPAGSTNYVQNGTGLQTGNFNLNGNGTLGGAFTANSVNSETNYSIGGIRVLSSSGANNIFAGTGTATTGNGNSFFGAGSGSSNVTGTSNTLLGNNANVGSGNLTFATAVGAGSTVNNNNSVVLGRPADTVRVPGDLTVTGVFSAPSFTLPAANITGVLEAAKGGTGLNSTGATGNFLRSTPTGWQSQPLLAADIPSLASSYIQNNGGLQSGASFNIGGNGAIAGTLTVGGGITGSLATSNLTGLVSVTNGGTGINSAGTSGHFLKSTGSGFATSALTAAEIPSLAASYIQVNPASQQAANFNIAGNGTIGGSLTVGGGINGSLASSNLTGAVSVTNGGTGLNSAGLPGHFLKSTGSGFATSALTAAEIPSLAASYLQINPSGQQAGSFNVAGNGTVGGNLTVNGTITGSFSVPAANITGTLSALRGGTGISGVGLNGHFLKSDGTNWTTSALSAGDLPAGSTSYIQNTTTSQAGANLAIGGTGTIGTLAVTGSGNVTSNLTVGGNLTVNGTFGGSFTVPVANITGVLPVSKGGTGFGASTGTNFFRGDNAGGWTLGGLTAADIPNLAANYIPNSGTQSAGTFNIAGDGTVGGTSNANIVNAVTQYNINGTRVFTTSGTDNIFAGAGAGNTGSKNSFFGSDAGNGNVTGSSNTIIGANADVGGGALTNATAIGANAIVTQSDSLVLGGVSSANGGTDTKVGIGTTAPKAKLDVAGGNILVGDPGAGFILRAPNGTTCALISLTNGGALSTVSTPCP